MAANDYKYPVIDPDKVSSPATYTESVLDNTPIDATDADEINDTGWTPVASSNIEAVRYTYGDKTLWVRFTSGREYTYKTDDGHYNGLLSASSPGSYFHMNIKNSIAAERVA